MQTMPVGHWQRAVGTGRNRALTTHIDNLVQAIRLLLGTALPGEVVNIVDELDGTLDEILKSLLAAFSLLSDILYIPVSIALPFSYGAQCLHHNLRSKRPRLLTPFVVPELSKGATLDVSRVRRL
jgi:nucleoside-diphosphate-sugar epimerase